VVSPIVSDPRGLLGLNRSDLTREQLQTLELTQQALLEVRTQRLTVPLPPRIEITGQDYALAGDLDTNRDQETADAIGVGRTLAPKLV
jgi:hypothetical protein